MTAIMIFHIHSKYTAVGECDFFSHCRRSVEHIHLTGRKEIIMFFYLYAIIELLAIFLDSGIIPTSNASYPVRGAVLMVAAYMSDVRNSSGLRQYTRA